METRLGRDLVDSLSALADRMESEDFRWVAQAIDIQRAVGGDLAQILDTVSETIRERNPDPPPDQVPQRRGPHLRLHPHRHPFALAIFITLMAPEYIAPCGPRRSARSRSASAGCSLLAGVFWIRRLIELKF